jgi:DNA-binding NarL/FixJ family response regulator
MPVGQKGADLWFGLQFRHDKKIKKKWIMDTKKFKVIIVEDVKLELKGTEEIFRHEIPNAEVIGTAMTEAEFWPLLEKGHPDMVLLDLGLGGSTTIGVDICASLRKDFPGIKVLIFTGEVLNEKLWVDVLNAGADGIILKTGELLTAVDVQAVMEGKKLVFNYPILEKIVARFKESVALETRRQEAIIMYDIDEYDERLLRHLALGYTKEMMTNLKGMPFGIKSLEKRQNELIARLFKPEERSGVNACRLVTRAFELHILDVENLEEDEE